MFDKSDVRLRTLYMFAFVRRACTTPRVGERHDDRDQSAAGQLASDTARLDAFPRSPILDRN